MMAAISSNLVSLKGTIYGFQNMAWIKIVQQFVAADDYVEDGYFSFTL